LSDSQKKFDSTLTGCAMNAFSALIVSTDIC
jgi:hypothetical protein